jgi:hypothetical protein
MGLKIFWGAIAAILLSGLLYLAFKGLPAPAVEIRKNVPLHHLLKPTGTP